VIISKVVYIEILKSTVNSTEDIATKTKGKPKNENNPFNKIDVKLISLLTKIVESLVDESGWTFLGNLGKFILKKKADFDTRNYGFQKLLPLIKATNKFVVDDRDAGNNNIRHIYLKIK
jgi:hypothetical protein